MSTDVLDDAAGLLSGALGGPVRLEAIEQPRDLVWRARVADGPPDAPASVILRLGPERSQKARPAQHREQLRAVLAREWAGTVFLAGISGLRGTVPRLLGGDPAIGLLVAEDLGAGPSLADLLLGDDAQAAEAGLLAHASAWGRLVALTHGRVREYEALLAGTAGLGTASLLDGMDAAPLHELLEAVGIPAPPGLDDEVARARRLIDHPGDWLVYSPADACPDNNVIADGTVKVFDFGFGHPRHLALDAAYAAVPFPHCWCAAPLPRGLRERLVAAFRTPVAAQFAPAGDDAAFGEAVADANVGWFAAWVARRALRALDGDRQGPGPLSERQVAVAHLEAVPDWVAEHRPLSAEVAAEAASRLRGLWGVADPPTYPALR